MTTKATELERILQELEQHSPQMARAAQAEARREFAAPLEGWQVYGLAEAYKERPPIEYAVSGLFSMPSLSIVYGAPGTLKSMLLVDVAMCVAAGEPWLPPLPEKQDEVTPRSTVQSPILWVDFDNGKRRTDERIEAAGRVRGLPEATPFHYVVMPYPWLDGGDPISVDYLRRCVDGIGARLVVIDNLGFVTGDIDENSAAMTQVLASFRRVAEGSEAAVILVHHQRKSTGFSGRAGENLRGHSSIEQSLDLALLIERKEHADTVELKSTKTRDVDVLPFGAMFTFAHKPGTSELATMRFYGIPIVDLKSDKAIRTAIREAIGETSGVMKSALKTAVKEQLPEVGINRIGDNIDYLVAEGEILVATGKGTAKHYTLPGQDLAF